MLWLWPLESNVQRLQQLWSVFVILANPEIKRIHSSPLTGGEHKKIYKNVDYENTSWWIKKKRSCMECLSIREQTHTQAQIKSRSWGGVALQWIFMDFVQSSWRVAVGDKERGTQETNRGAKRQNNHWRKSTGCIMLLHTLTGFPQHGCQQVKSCETWLLWGLRKQQREANTSL